MVRISRIVGLIGFLFTVFSVRADIIGDDAAICESFKLATGDADVAIDRCTRAIGAGGVSSKKLAHLYYKRGNAFSKKGENQRALQDYNDSIRINPQYPNAYFNRGQTWHDLKDFDRAIEDHSTVLKFKPKDWEAYYFRGWGYLEKAEYDNAIADLDTSIRLHRNFRWSHIHRGTAWEKKGDFSRALADFDEAVRLAPRDPFVYSHRGRVRFFKGQFSAAAADFKKANSIKDDNPYFVLWLYIARARIDVTSAGTELFRLAHRVDSRHWPITIVSFYRGQAEDRQVFKRAYDPDENRYKRRTCEAKFFVGEWYLTRGEKTKASALFEEVKDECPSTMSEYTGALVELGRSRQLRSSTTQGGGAVSRRAWSAIIGSRYDAGYRKGY